MLEAIDTIEKQLIERAIEYHGLKKLPQGLDGSCLLFAKMIRDADKLDIFHVVTTYYKQYRDNPENFPLEVELPDEPRCSAEIIEAILAGRRIGYNQLRTLNDMKLLQLGWIYDVNFTATLKRIKQRRFLETMLDFLPKTGDIERVGQKIFAYIDSAIEQDRE